MPMAIINNLIIAFYVFKYLTVARFIAKRNLHFNYEHFKLNLNMIGMITLYGIT